MNPKLVSVLNELLMDSSSSSSSSSDSSTEDYILLFDSFGKDQRHSIENFVENVVENYTDDEFRKHFRVTRQTAKKITERFASSRFFKQKVSCGGRKVVNPQTQCLSFLWFAGNKSTFREVSNLFNISLSSAYKHQTAFMELLFDISPEFIRMPTTTDEKQKISQAFSMIAGINNVIGCIDGSYIYIRNPAGKVRSTYVNRHGLISITMQGICDADKKFLDVFVGPTSKIHDSRIYKLSHISKDIPTICGNTYHLLGDAAYPLREFLLTPFRDYGNFTMVILLIIKKKYNKKHCQTRVKIENTFGLLKQRFRQLMRLDCWTVMRMSMFVMGCCVLHNLCIEEGDLWCEDESDSASSGEVPTPETEIDNEQIEVNAVLLQRGQIKRNLITQLM